MKSNKISGGNTAVTPKMGAVIIVTAIHALIFCSAQQMQKCPLCAKHHVPSPQGLWKQWRHSPLYCPPVWSPQLITGCTETPLRNVRMEPGGLPGGMRKYWARGRPGTEACAEFDVALASTNKICECTVFDSSSHI